MYLFQHHRACPKFIRSHSYITNDIYWTRGSYSDNSMDQSCALLFSRTQYVYGEYVLDLFYFVSRAQMLKLDTMNTEPNAFMNFPERTQLGPYYS